MERYIGIDAHQQTCTVAVMGPSGRRLTEQVVESNGQALKQFLASFAGEKHVCLEEGELSEWLYELLLPVVKEVVVVQPEKRRGHKSDSVDAWALAELLRTNRKATVVYKAAGTYRGLREAVQAHRALTRDVVRTKNRLKAIFRRRGIRGLGEQLYSAELRQPWLAKLCVARRRRAELYGAQLDRLLPMQQQAEAWVRQEAGACGIVKILATAPGIGVVRGSQTVATVVTPNRFRSKRPFWAYCGLAVVSRSSSDWEPKPRGGFRRRGKELTRGLNRNRNPLLKAVFKGAALTAIQSKPEDPLVQNYFRNVDAGMDPALARVTLARQLSAVVLAMWKSKEVYDPTRYASSKTA